MNAIIGQCHKYTEYDTSPKKTKILFDKRVFIMLSEDISTNTVATHGIKAKAPGKQELSRMNMALKTIIKIPNKLRRKDCLITNFRLRNCSRLANDPTKNSGHLAHNEKYIDSLLFEST